MKPRIIVLLILLLALTAGCGANVQTVTVTPTITPDVPATETQVAIKLEQTAQVLEATADSASTLAAEAAIAEAAQVTQAAIDAQATLDADATMTEIARPTDTPVPTNSPVPTDTPVPTNTPVPTETLEPSLTPLPAPTETSWQEYTLPDLGLQISIPTTLAGPTQLDAESVLFGAMPAADVSPHYIVVLRTAIDPADFGLSDTASPDEILSAAVADTVNQLGATITKETTPLATTQEIPAAQAQLTVDSLGVDVAFVLFHVDQDDWVLLNLSGTAEEMETWIAPLVASLAISPLPQPEASAEAQPTPEFTAANAADALGLDFTAPEGWDVYPSDHSPFAITPVEIKATDDPENRSIALVRGTAAEYTAIGFPEGESDPLKLLEGIANFTIASNNEGFSSGRYNDIAIGDFIGAWTQIRNDNTTLRYYLFPAGAGEWLLIGARGNRDTFNAFSRAELKDFLGSLALRPDEGVALGLDFTLPEGWHYIEVPTDTNEGLTGEAIQIKPEDENPDNRYLIFARGTAEDLEGLQFPADAADSATALQPVAEYIRDRNSLGTRLRVEDVQIGDFRGSIVNLRGEDTAVRLYLFGLGSDDWLFIMASADRAAFNGFNRAELRDIMGSLSLAAGEAGALTVQPIGPIEEVTVAHVSDGDTIYVMLNGVEESVRIIGIDTPEAHHPDSGADWLGYTATNFMDNLIKPGDTVYLESDIRDRDDFQRLLRYVWIKDADGNFQMIEAALIRAGLAHVRTYDEDRYVPYFMSLEREAMAEKLGVWGDAPPAPPADSLATRNDVVWAASPGDDEVPLLFDAAALGNVPDPVAAWPNNITAVVRDVYYVYPTDIDPVTDAPVSEEKVGYWYWLEINDFRGWVPESWLILEEPENPVPGPDTDIIAYAEPFVVSDAPLEVWSGPAQGYILGTFEPESRVQARRISMDMATGEWWMYVQTQTLDGWVPLANLNRLSPDYR